MSATGAGRRTGRDPWPAHLLALALCAGAVLLPHLPFLNLPYYWDEAGYYVPAARDFLHTGSLIPRSTAANPHPPLLSMYLAGAWKLFGESPAVTRAAMALVAGASLYALLLLAAGMVPPGAGLWAAALTAATPVFFAQSTLAHLDMAATLGTLLALHFYLRRRLTACIIAGTLLCLARETGAVLVVTLAALDLTRDGSSLRPPEPARAVSRWRPALAGSRGAWRRALMMMLPLVPLAAWFVLLRWRTGLWLGDRSFTDYNFWGALHPARWVLQFGKRVYQLGAANFHWVAALLIAVAARRRVFTTPPEARRALLAFAAAHVVFVSVFGGASLTRYLLPVFPLFFLLAADAAFQLRWRGRGAVLLLLPAALVACWFWNPPYPYACEDNLSYADFVRLHRATAPMLDDFPPGTRILTAWPASDELSRPWLGYVSKPLEIVPVADFSREELGRVPPERFDVLFLFSRQSRPEWFDSFPRLAALQDRYFGIRRQAPPEWIGERFGLERRTHTELGSQWVEIWARPGVRERPSPVFRAAAR